MKNRDTNTTLAMDTALAGTPFRTTRESRAQKWFASRSGTRTIEGMCVAPDVGSGGRRVLDYVVTQP